MLFHMMNWLRREDGQDLAEYALLIALIAVVAAGAVVLLGTQISNTLDAITAAIAGSLP